MSVTNLRKVDDSIMLEVPPSIVNMLNLEPGSLVDVTVEKRRLIIEPIKKPSYTLKELLVQCKPRQKRVQEEDAWFAQDPIGKELL